MRVKSVVIVLIFLGSVLSGCTGNDSENDERVEALETELADSISSNDDALSKIVTLEGALSEAVESVSSLEESVASLRINLSNAESQRDELILERDGILLQLNQSEGNEVNLTAEILILNQNIQELNSQISSLGSDLQQSQNQISQLEITISTLQSVMDSLTYTLNYRTSECLSLIHI